MQKRYVNAAKTLPPELLKAISEALGGEAGYVWIPARRNLNRGDRDRHIAALRAKGCTAAEIADEIFLSERNVWRIIARLRREAQEKGATA
jgi:DNA-binding NarL/FixJ family response regulator